MRDLISFTERRERDEEDGEFIFIQAQIQGRRSAEESNQRQRQTVQFFFSLFIILLWPLFSVFLFTTHDDDVYDLEVVVSIDDLFRRRYPWGSYGTRRSAQETNILWSLQTLDLFTIVHD